MPSSSPYAKPSASVGRSKSDASLMRDKTGCITCRVRQKVSGILNIWNSHTHYLVLQKCTGIAPGEVDCGDCIRLNIHCLGVHHNRPDWLRNPEALKETKYRIKHHLTEYPVPRGRGPAPVRPFLSFQDLIEKYSPQRFVPSGSASPNLESERLYRIEPDSPVAYAPSQSASYLSVQTNLYPSPNTPSPSTPYTSMPLTPSSSDGSLFVSPDAPVPCGYPFQTDYMNQSGL
ncbi:hypothetical protein FRC08_001532 [Ceratobasidium sp. 394]|nr:hypothetical protein FRC08_001532 [Ceratobasidium sp. 394]